MKCFLHREMDCHAACMASCEQDGKPMCSIINSLAMMGAVSAQALKMAMTPKTKHPPSAPPPKVTP